MTQRIALGLLLLGFCGCQPADGPSSGRAPSMADIRRMGAPYADVPCPVDPCDDSVNSETVRREANVIPVEWSPRLKPPRNIPGCPTIDPVASRWTPVRSSSVMWPEVAWSKVVYQPARLGSAADDSADGAHDPLDLVCDERPDPLIRTDRSGAARLASRRPATGAAD